MPYACLPSPFGTLTLFEEDGALVAAEWGMAEAPSSSPLLRTALDQLDAYFAGELRQFTVPICPAGTGFQRRVWSRMVEIPYGETVTYGALASELATAPRAVARACASNPLPIFVPCHRIIAANRGLGGYSGGDGLETKVALLRLEDALSSIRLPELI